MHKKQCDGNPAYEVTSARDEAAEGSQSSVSASSPFRMILSEPWGGLSSSTVKALPTAFHKRVIEGPTSRLLFGECVGFLQFAWMNDCCQWSGAVGAVRAFKSKELINARSTNAKTRQ